MKRFFSGLLCLMLMAGAVVPPALAEGAEGLSIALPEGADDALTVGETLELRAEITPPGAEGLPLIWSSGDASVAIVDDDGRVTALAAGDTVVSVTAGDGLEDSLALHVQEPPAEETPTPEPPAGETPTPEPPEQETPTPEPPAQETPTPEPPAVPVETIVVTDVDGNASDVVVLLDKTLQLVSLVSPEGATEKGVNWSIDAPDSTDPDAGSAGIDGNGLVTGLTQGLVTVRATAADGSNVSGALEITVLDPSLVMALGLGGVTVTAEGNAAVLGTEKTLQLTAAVAPVESAQTVEWTIQSGDASIDANGLLTAGNTEGPVLIRATSTADPAVFGELTIQIVTAYEYVLVLNTNPDPTVTETTGVLDFDGTGASTQPSRTSQTYQAGADVQRSASTGGYHVGESKTIGYTDYICIGVGEHCYVWMEEGLKADYAAAGVIDTAAAEMLAVYQGRPYQALTTLAGGELPTMDGTGKLSILMERLTSSSGYFAGEDGITAIHIKASSANDYTFGDLDAYAGLLAHEGQHALFQHFVCGDDAVKEQPLRWLNEGLSIAVMDWVWGGDGNGDQGWLSTIGGNDRIRGGESLSYANYRSDSGLDYGLPYLFVRYLTDQAANRYNPLPHLEKFYRISLGSKTPAAYLDAVIASLGLTGNASYLEALQNFYIAAVAQTGSGVFGFCGDPVVSKRVSYPLFDGASGLAYDLPGTGALILKTENGVFTPPADAGSDMVFVPFNKDASASAWGGGLGTPDDPYEVNRESILGAIALNPSGYYKLTEDIDLTGTTVFTIDSFSGTLNGDGHTIRGVGAPLIYENSGTVLNLNVELDMDGQYSGFVGGVVGLNRGTVRNVTVSGTFSGRLTGTNPYGFPVAGALVGKNYGDIHACKADVAMHPGLPANHAYLGEIAGWNCYRIYDCIAQGSISATQSAPGSYSLYAGGLVGYLYSDNFVASLKTSYSLTAVDAQGLGAGNAAKAGRLVGREQKRTGENTVLGCYGLAGLTAAGQTEAESAQKVLSDAACLKTAEQLKTPATFTGWDTDVWNLASGAYPRFGGSADPSTLPVSGAKSSYYVGEALSLAGTTVRKGNGDVVTVTPSMLYDVPDLGTAGNYVVRGVCDAVAFSFPIAVTVPTVTALSVKTPARSDYYAGWMFEQDGAELTAVIDGNEITVVSGYTVDKTAPLMETDTAVTYTYFGKTATQPITVRPRAIQSVVRTAPAAKSAYSEGEPLSLAGLTLRLTYSDGAQVNGVTPDHFARYGLKLLWVSGGTIKEIPDTKTLSALEDDGARLYVYLGSTVPASLSGVYCEALTLDVGNLAHMTDQTIIMHTGFRASDFDEYVYSDAVEGGSYDYSTTRISGEVPAGVSVQTPDSNYDSFIFYGKPASAFDVSLVYRITDRGQGHTFYVTIRLTAVPLSDACDVLSVTLGGVPCTVGTDTITVVLPQGRSLTGLALNATLSPGAKSDPWNGTQFDCSNGNAPTLTVYPQSNLDNDPSGAKKVYTLHASVASANALSAPAGVTRTVSTVGWEPVSGATGYLVTLMRSAGDTAYADLVGSYSVAEPRFDMWPNITRSGRYFINIRAVDGSLAAPMSPEATTAADLYYCNLTPVGAISVSGPSSVISGGTGSYRAAVTPYDAGNTAVDWSCENGAGTATITPAGLLTGGTPGLVTIKATARDGSGVVGTLSVTILESTASRVVTVDVSGIERPERALWIDGIAYTDANGLAINGTQYTVELTDTTAATAVVYSFNSLTETDVHKVYPTGMSVWTLAYANDRYEVTRAAALDNLLRYSGSSIRITGTKGIRMITSIATDTKNALTGAGIDGYTLLEYGTAVAWTGELGADSLVLGRSYTKPAYAYKKNVGDPVFKQTGGLTQYTNVLVGFDIAKCSPDLAMRPYIILENAGGDTITLYGGTIFRSIGYIAYQNRDAFTPKTPAYEYIWEIIKGVYGAQYDADYKG